MALSSRTPTGLDTAGFIPEIYLNEVKDATQAALVCWNAFDTNWGNGLKKGDTFYFPITNDVTATEVVVGTKGTAKDPATGTKVTLSIDQWFEAPIDVDVMSEGQSHIDWGPIAKEKGAYSVAKKVDTTINALFASLSSSSVYGSDGQEFTDDIMYYLYQTLLDQNVPWDGNVSLIGTPATLIDLLKWDKILAAQYGSIGSISNGTIGKTLFGATFRFSTNLTAATTGKYGVLAHKKAIKGLMQLNTPWMKPFEELHQVRYQHEALWGVCEFQDTFGISFYTRA